jgi:hypothetical protein
MEVLGQGSGRGCWIAADVVEGSERGLYAGPLFKYNCRRFNSLGNQPGPNMLGNSRFVVSY